ncbi:hypothetical protein [Sphaerisporangium dianthi]|uniref:Uncharacterized protein n=1 Tax=Sphaerisporangium dianthi TaxID=1436120 RepID=A0ABV9CLY0_9ACTN
MTCRAQSRNTSLLTESCTVIGAGASGGGPATWGLPADAADVTRSSAGIRGRSGPVAESSVGGAPSAPNHTTCWNSVTVMSGVAGSP